MKKVYLTLLSCFITIVSMSQTPGFSYQAVILNPDVQSLPGNDVEQGLLSESDIAICFTIENELGIEYKETHLTKTDAYGMISLIVGQGMATIGNFTDVAWVGSEKYLKVEIDFTASGASYESLDRQVLTYLPQPLSLESNNRINDLELAINTVAADLTTIQLTPGPQGNAGTNGSNGTNGIDGVDGIDGAPGIQGVAGATGNPGTNGTNGIDGVGIGQILSISGDTLFISSGNYIILPTPNLLGCTDSLALNYNALANTDDGSCIPIINGCTDNTQFNYNPLANTDNGSCIPFIFGCMDPSALNYDPNANTDDGSCTYLAIGGTHQGGIIFWLDGNGGGLIAAPSDQSSSAEWGCNGLLVGAYGTGIGTGNQNTIDIVAGCSSSGTAADICTYSSAGYGYSGWFLPSKDELNEMYLNLHQQGLGGFAGGGYWSSTEVDYTKAWAQDFNFGNQGFGNKTNSFSVRAVRAF